GGAPSSRVALTNEPIDVTALVDDLATTEAGAVATFVGTVRAESDDGRALSALEYAAYDEMALELLGAIRRRAGEKFELLDAAVVHRLGRVSIGEASIAVVVVSAHRAAAFDAVRYIVDAVKTDVPIWKKDIWSDGTANW